MHGLVCLVDGLTHSLPLVRVVVEASLVDVSAQVVVRQQYKNDGTLRTDCSYQFPVPARAAVTAVALVKEDGSRVVGVVQEKEEARITYDEAVKEGKLSSLMEQASPDAFTTSVGNILPNELVTVELTYVIELTEGDSNDSIRFHVPAHVGCRYGDSPSMSSVAQPASTTSTFFSVDAKIESVAAITKVNCPSHAVSTELGTDPSLPDADLLPSADHARISCTSNLALSSDFVLEITSAGLDRPRCVVEHHPASDSAAVSLTVVPRFELPEVKGQEWVFVIDRSGSMGSWGAPAGGSGRIGLARKALVVLLRSLPSRDSLFNIVSFGSSHNILWSSGSRAYNQSTLDEATKLVDSMEADMGGTEIRSTMDSVFELRDEKRPTSVFVLTDGDVWDLDGVLDSVKTAVSSSSADAPLRVFSLGIGESASTAMVDGLARVGRGIAQYVSDGESFTGKAARLVRAARSPPILNARLDFGVAARAAAAAATAAPSAPSGGDDDDGFELVEPVKEVVDSVAGEIKSISLFDETVDPLKRDEQTVPPIEPVALPRPAPIQLAPSTLHSLYSGSRLHAYGIVTPASLLGDKVTLRGELATGEQLELDVPLVKVRTSPSANSPPLLHALAARKLIQELEDGSHVVTPPRTEGNLAARSLKAAVVRLGKQYSLASTHTSFVAVDEADAKRGKVPRAVVHIVEGGGMARFGGGGAGGGFGGAMPLMAMAAPAPAPGGPPPRGLLRSRAAPLATTFAAPPEAAAATMFAAPVPPPPSALAPRRRSLFRSAAADPPHGLDTSIAPSMAASSSVEPPLTPSFGGESGPSAASSADQNSAPPVAVTPADRLVQLARAQAFDGSFGHAALAALPDVPSFEALPEQVRARACEGVRATLAVLAFFERGVAGEEEEAWAGMAEKARAWVADELGASDEEVQGWVEALK